MSTSARLLAGGPLHLLEPLLIRKAQFLGRLELIQTYLRNRHLHAHSGTSIFKHQEDVRSFAVRYFDQSVEHRHLEERIERDALLKRLEKKAELQRKNEQHRSLTAKASALDHEHRKANRKKASRHHRNCRKCSLEKQARSLKIEPHEWPLPQDDTEAKAAVSAREILERAFMANPESEQIWLAAVKLKAENGKLGVARELLVRAQTVADTERVSSSQLFSGGSYN
jgi:hypothetical protein